MRDELRRLAERIRRQRQRLRWFEANEHRWSSSWRHAALAYRRQLEEMGVKPVSWWSATYKHEIERERERKQN